MWRGDFYPRWRRKAENKLLADVWAEFVRLAYSLCVSELTKSLLQEAKVRGFDSMSFSQQGKVSGDL
jgi:hypothetical protein